MMKKYIFNNYYILRHDAKRSYILSQGDYITPPAHVAVNLNLSSMIHPVYAMMLSFFSEPVTIEEACANISSFLSINKEIVVGFINRLLETDKAMHTDFANHENGFPVNLIIEEEKETFPRVMYTPDEFAFTELDFDSPRRYAAPLSIVFMPNNNCYTKCIYCYADTTPKPRHLSLDCISKFIKEAKDIGVRDFLITGGDLFMYRHWKELLDILEETGFLPDLISTKKPLSDEEVTLFAKFGIRLQLSLDSMDEETAMKVLHVKPGYIEQMKASIQKIEETGIRYQIATVLTSINDSLVNLDEMYGYLSQLKNLKRWEIRIAFKSLYSKSNFDEIKSKRVNITAVSKWIDERKSQFPCEILWSPDDDAKYHKTKGGSQYFEGNLCSANISNMVILPDGQVTVCEQLYWNKNFIIGNVNESSLKEIWTSERAMSLWKRKQESINANSPCSSCKIFDKCFTASNRCYADIMKAYGTENFDFPDPRCYWAPKFINNVTHE